MAMTVDAMELLYTEKPDAFGIVSSDADFTPLVMHLRAKGAAVYGFGAEQTPRAFVNACSRFLYFDALKELGDGIASRSERREALEDAVPRAVPAAASRRTDPAGNGRVAGGTGVRHRHAPRCACLRTCSRKTGSSLCCAMPSRRRRRSRLGTCGGGGHAYRQQVVV
jgi:hypothetical protein